MCLASVKIESYKEGKEEEEEEEREEEEEEEEERRCNGAVDILKDT